jgi:uncharacterized Zn finger protein
MKDLSEKCPKCSGLIIKEIIIAEGYWIKEVRCVNCGERIHAEVLAERRRELRVLRKEKSKK